MKSMAIALVLFLSAGALFAGEGKSCDPAKHAAKKVELNGTLSGKTFRVAGTNKAYTVCDKTENAVLELGKNGATNLQIKGKVVSCGDAEGEELLIVEAKKI
jgi:hypothetical protein